MADGRPFPLNAWYAAAWSHEIQRELSARTICDKDVVLYRRTDGRSRRWRTPAGIGCCRFRSAGSTAIEVMCGYHGLVFNSAGRCTFHAGAEDHQSVGLRARLSRRRAASAGLDLAGRSRALADPAKLPDFHWNDGTEWVGEGGTFYSLNATIGWSSTI